VTGIAALTDLHSRRLAGVRRNGMRDSAHSAEGRVSSPCSDATVCRVGADRRLWTILFIGAVPLVAPFHPHGLCELVNFLIRRSAYRVNA
jgi:hypothetical protein